MTSRLNEPTDKPAIDLATIAAAVSPERLANDLATIDSLPAFSRTYTAEQIDFDLLQVQ